MPLIRYWPTREEINRCIKTEAESAPDAVLLAVHQPMSLVQRAEGTGTESLVGEYDLLDAFLSDDLPQGTLLVPITGPSGSGKSHLIRWLAAQLARDPRSRERMHVIRIPKSASLRDVVELILSPLSGDERFAGLRESLDKAISQFSPAEAAVQLSGALEIELDKLKTRLLAELANNPTEPRRSSCRNRANHAKRLPGFLNDAALREHMTKNVLTPIIQRAVEGRVELKPGEEEKLPKFRASDLKIPDCLRTALGQASMPTQTYYRASLNLADGAGFEDAAKVLNEVRDSAIGRVFQLDQATGGVTLESIILRVRELLLEQQQELVLLIEDFAALSGIQRALLSVCIQEAERDGEQIRARMRTALALTDGFLDDRDTIATRARYEWRILPGSDGEDVLERALDLTGAYLNAARWGQHALEKAYAYSSRESGQDLTGWVQTFDEETLDDEDSNQLGKFGRNRQGVPLFPFNKSAVVQLTKRHLRIAGELRFNPRRVINFVLRDVLLSGREAFKHANFPPPEFQQAKASASLASWLAAEGLSEHERGRLEAFLVYWGGNPSDPAQAGQLPAEVFKAFGLSRPESLDGLIPPPGLPPDPPAAPTPPDKPPPRTPPEAPQVDEWSKRLDAWARGTELPQGDASKLRNILKKLVDRGIPWNRLRLDRRALNQTLLLTIPNARGNEAPARIRVAIAEDHSDPNGQLRQALLAALRLDEANGRLDYPGVDEDAARVSILVEGLLDEIIPHLEVQRTQEVQVLSWLLRRQARVLGLVPAKQMPPLDTEIHALWYPTPEQGRLATPAFAETQRWQQLRTDAAAVRPALQEALRARIACFQGTGDTASALDPTLLDLAVQPDALDPGFLDRVQREHFSQIKLRLAPATRPLLKRLTEIASKVQAALGPQRDKQQLLTALPALFDALTKVGAWPDGFDRATLRGQLTAFGKYDLIAQLKQVDPLLATDDAIDHTADATLERLGRLDLDVVEAAQGFLERAEAFVSAAERAMQSKEGSLVGIDPDEDAKDLERDLRQIQGDLGTIIGDGDQ